MKLVKRFAGLILMLSVLLICVMGPATISADAAAQLYWPVPGHTALSRGYTSDHKALDIHDGSINGATVIAAMGGTVHRIWLCGTQHYGDYHDCNGFGTGLVIKGDDGRFYQYAHMQAGSIPSNVYYGGYVAAGAMLGRVGTTGNSTGPHLHFSITSGSTWYPANVNPAYESYIYTNPGGSAVTMAWTEVNAAPTNTDAHISVKLIPSCSGSFGEIGVTLYDGNGNIVGQKSETADPSASTYLNVWYDITAEVGAVLNAGHKYTYQYYAYFNGTRFESDVYSFTTTGAADHVYGNWSVQKAATCTKDGTEARACKICGAQDTRTIKAVGHNEVKLNGKAATCTENGLTEGKKCSVCSTVTVAQQTIKAAGHVYDNDKDASCNVCGAKREVQVGRQPVDMFRMYDPNSGEHFYTGSTVERANLIAEGWNYEGVGFTFPKTTGKPVYRLYDPIYGEHLYTMDENEKAGLMRQGWNLEGVAFNSGETSEVPQYRLHNPNAKRGAYHFTASKVEMANLITAGWEYQGIGWYSLGSMNE